MKPLTFLIDNRANYELLELIEIKKYKISVKIVLLQNKIDNSLYERNFQVIKRDRLKQLFCR